MLQDSVYDIYIQTHKHISLNQNQNNPVGQTHKTPVGQTTKNTNKHISLNQIQKILQPLNNLQIPYS